MSSSSDIEKLFDKFGGDASAYQEIGRENEARSARTRWPLLVTLDLTQPSIPAIGQQREPKSLTPTGAAASVAGQQDKMPQDVAAVTRAKAPLFTRSHRRDIPPVTIAAPAPAAPTGASRFGAVEDIEQRAAGDAAARGQAAQASSKLAAAPIAPVAPVASVAPTAPLASAPVPPIATEARLAPIPPAMPAAAAPFQTSVTQPVSPDQTAAWARPTAPAAAWGQSQAAVPPQVQSHAFAPAPAWVQSQTSPPAVPGWAPAQPQTPNPGYPRATATPAAPPAPAPSILGKLFTAQPQSAPLQASAPTTPAAEHAPLQSVFDRLRGASASTSATPASAPRAAAPGVSNSWLVNGPRRS
jgi:hypothetical protein